jgi:hypothetical protein
MTDISLIDPCLAFSLGPRKKKAANSICPYGLKTPTIIVEVGNSENLQQLQIDAQQWLESTFHKV